MKTTWQIQEAKNRLSEVIDRACSFGRQVITKRKKPTAVLLSMSDYLALTRPNESLKDFFRKSPLKDIDLDWHRAKDYPREHSL
ncbi:MAG: type II toxin-antitoxin system Phd/YefM family antitoxin [Verrucomicrobiota bacterium]